MTMRQLPGLMVRKNWMVRIKQVIRLGHSARLILKRQILKKQKSGHLLIVTPMPNPSGNAKNAFATFQVLISNSSSSADSR